MFERISINPNIAGGKPTVYGTRIPIAMVLDLLEDGVTFEQIRRDYYPQLSIADIRACIEYANALVQGEEIHFAEEART